MRLSPPQFFQMTTRQLGSMPRFGIGGNLRTPTTAGPEQNTNDLRHHTFMLRDKALFKVLPEILEQRFSRGVPIYIYGGSLGAEADGVAMSLALKMGVDKARKYPIHNSDVVKDVVDIAKLHLITKEDMDEFNNLFGKNSRDLLERIDYETLKQITNEETFFNLKKARDNWYKPRVGYLVSLAMHQFYRLKPEVRTLIRHEIKDVREDFNSRKKTLKRPRVVMFRNAWYHLPKEKRQVLMAQMFRRLAPGSLLIVGRSEFEYVLSRGMHEYIEATGFKRLVKYVPGKKTTEQDPRVMIFERPALSEKS